MEATLGSTRPVDFVDILSPGFDFVAHCKRRGVSEAQARLLANSWMLQATTAFLIETTQPPHKSDLCTAPPKATTTASREMQEVIQALASVGDGEFLREAVLEYLRSRRPVMLTCEEEGLTDTPTACPTWKSLLTEVFPAREDREHLQAVLSRLIASCLSSEQQS